MSASQDGDTNTMENWHAFSDPRFTLRFKYPATTPRGHAVERQETQRDNSVRVHLASRDSQELYFEIVKFLKERVVTLVQRDRATYRIIYDPNSPINVQVLSTIEFVN